MPKSRRVLSERAIAIIDFIEYANWKALEWGDNNGFVVGRVGTQDARGIEYCDLIFQGRSRGVAELRQLLFVVLYEAVNINYREIGVQYCTSTACVQRTVVRYNRDKQEGSASRRKEQFVKYLKTEWKIRNLKMVQSWMSSSPKASTPY